MIIRNSRPILLAFLFMLFAGRSYSGFSHTIELEGDVIHIILTAWIPMGWGQCPEPIIYWIATEDSLQLKVLHLWQGVAFAAGCSRIDTVSITPSPFFEMPCKLLIERSWIWGSSLLMHSLEEDDLCTVDVPENPAWSMVGLAPNPASDFVLINGMAPGNSFEVFDVTGQMVTEGMIRSEQHPLDVQAWRKGAYLVRLRDRKGHVVTKRLIVE